MKGINLDKKDLRAIGKASKVRKWRFKVAICSLNLCKIKMSVKIVLAVTLLVLIPWIQSPFSFTTRTLDYNMTVTIQGPRAL